MHRYPCFSFLRVHAEEHDNLESHVLKVAKPQTAASSLLSHTEGGKDTDSSEVSQSSLGREPPIRSRSTGLSSKNNSHVLKMYVCFFFLTSYFLNYCISFLLKNRVIFSKHVSLFYVLDSLAEKQGKR